MSSSIKRCHTPSPSPASSSSRTPKAPRIAASPRSPLLCTLPPTCHPPNRPTPLPDSRALEAHYATHHAHVCSSPGCGCVFPDARLLELHLAECHDPLAEIRRESGEKTFACHLQSCSRMFANPKARRLHLIAAHSYPKEYFFAVTNKGIGGLLRRWGEGASLLRGPWRPRDTEGNDGDEDNESTSHSRQSSSLQSDTDGQGDDNLTEGEDKFGPDSTSVRALAEQEGTTKTMDEGDVDGDGNEDAEVDALARDVSALGLVPSSVRFGRGGVAARGRAGLTTRSGRPAARHIGNLPDADHQAALDNKHKDIDMEVGESSTMQQHDGDDDDADKTPPTRGRRGRGRASVVDSVGRGGTRAARGVGRARALPPMPPRGGFLSRGSTWRAHVPRGMIAVRARGRGAGV